MRTVTESMHREGSRRSDQGQVWGAIAAKASSLGTDSETGAMADVFERHADRVADFVNALPSMFPSTGVGMDMRLSSERLNGAALIVDNQTVHLSAFAAQG